ncbi:MAG: hypothetical protein ACK4YO_01265 [Candidatus Altarchaeaceae archaeon]
MNVLFLCSNDLKESEYRREGNKNLLVTKFGIGDTCGICGKVVDIVKTKFGVMITLEDDYGNIVVTAGKFNKNALNDAKNILKKFNEKKDEIYLLIYANPFYKDDKIYLNANQDFCIFEVDKNTYEEFNKLRERAINYKEKKKEREEKEEGKIKEREEEYEEKFEIIEEIDPYSYYSYNYFEIDSKILGIIKKFLKDKEMKISDVVKNLKNEKFLKDIDIENKIYELIERGYFYEPRPGYIKLVQ